MKGLPGFSIVIGSVLAVSIGCLVAGHSFGMAAWASAFLAIVLIDGLAEALRERG